MHIGDLVPWVLGLLGTLLTGVVGMVWAKVERADATSAKNTILILDLEGEMKELREDVKKIPQQLDRLDERSKSQKESLARIEEYLLRQQQKDS